MSYTLVTFCSTIAMRSRPYVSSAAIGDSSSPPACWKYVNWVISMPSNSTCQPMPQAPSVGDSQLSSSNRMSWARVSMPHASRLWRYRYCTSSGAGLRITWNW